MSRPQTSISRSESRNGNGLSKALSTTLKIAEVAPIPNASVTIATTANPRLRISILNPKRKSPSTIKYLYRPATHPLLSYVRSFTFINGQIFQIGPKLLDHLSMLRP